MEYVAYVDYALNNIFRNDVWFRGHSDKTYALTPNLLRHKNYNQQIDRTLRENFKDKARVLVGNNTLTEFEWYFLMQHYGLKTRLLDWTEGSLIALFFALQVGPKEFEFEDACVWMIDPLDLNNISKKNKRLFRTDLLDPENADNDLVSSYINLKNTFSPHWPIAITTTYSNERILRQKGCFTLHHANKESIESIYRKAKSNRIAKITISGKHRSTIKNQLLQSGISESSIYPDLEGLSRELNDKHLNFNLE